MWSPYFFQDTYGQHGNDSSGYGLGWSVRCPDPFTQPEKCTSPSNFVAYHSGAAIGASSVLAVAPDLSDMKWTLYKNGNRMPSCDESSLQDKSAGNAAVLHTQPTKDVLQVVLSERENMLQSGEPKPKDPVPGPVKGVVVAVTTNMSDICLMPIASALIRTFSAKASI